MKKTFTISAVVYLLICSLTVLVLLSSTFVHLKREYFPSFMLAQQYALPLILSAMSVMYFTFFEPERLSQRMPVRFLQVLTTATFLIFSYFLTTLTMEETSIFVLSVYALQWLASLAAVVVFFRLKTDKAAV